MGASSTIGRVLALASASLACGLSSASAALVTFQLGLPPSDQAYGQALSEVWSDPFVRDMALLFALGGAGLGFAVSLWMLRGARLQPSIPVVFGVTTLAAAVAGPLGPIAVFPTLASGAWAMAWCQGRFPRGRNALLPGANDAAAGRSWSGCGPACLPLMILGVGAPLAALMGLALWLDGPVPVHPHSELLRSGDLVGWTRPAVIARVGEPSWRSDRAWYDLGPNGGFSGLIHYWEGSLERGILMVHFDVESGRVEKADVGRLARPSTESPFDPEAWRADSPTVRPAMLRSLLHDVVLQGMTKDELFAKLGPPDGRYREINYEDKKQDWMEPVLCIHLVLDENDVVTEQYTTDY